MPAVQLRTVATPPRRTPEREQLAEAIARHAAAEQRVARIAAAQEHASGATLEARVAVRKAQDARAETNEASFLAAVALGEADPANSPVKAAVVAIDDAEATLNLARRTSAALGEEEKAAASDLQRAKSRLDDAVADVMKAAVSVADLLKEAEAAQADLINRRIVLRHLHRTGCISAPLEQDVRSFLFDIFVLPATIGQAEFKNFDNHPAEDSWRAAQSALLRNADAPLPQG